MKHYLIVTYSLLILASCKKGEVKPNKEEPKPKTEKQTILNQLATDYKQLPEQAIAKSSDNSVYAQYAKPTKKYGHGILGDRIEAEQLVVVADSLFYEFTLPNNYVFEDIRPRLYDVDGDNELEIITIRTNTSKGAGIAIYKIMDNRLVEYAHVPAIGTAYRWLNIVTIHDLDNDGTVELVWIQTPHIGGILKVAKIKTGTLQVLAEKSQYSNHAIGERNLCLSVLTEQSSQKIFYVPNQSRNKIIGFTFKNNDLNAIEEIAQVVDFSKTLNSQYHFNNPIEEQTNCIHAE